MTFKHRMMIKKAPNLASINDFKGNESGQIAVWFAILALPLLIITSFTLDYARSEQVKLELSNALDDAAIAAVLNQNLSVSERARFAEDYFKQNFNENEGFTINVLDSSAERVEITATGSVPSSIIQAIGKDDISISESAVSELTKEDTICVLALDPSQEKSFDVSEGADFKALDCSVQVNSTHRYAAFVSSDSTASAKSFCAVGGVNGAFTPFANSECSIVEDPYKDVTAPASGSCISDKKLRLKSTGQNAAENGTMLMPGTYCGGLNVSGLDVKFAPGEYIMLDGPLVFTKESSAIAESVTFILRGKKSTLDIRKGSKLIVKAPKDGPLAGLAFFQDQYADTKKKPKLPSGTNSLSGAADMQIIGTVYFPTQEIVVGGGSGLGTQAPATSFIGYRVRFEDNSQIRIKTDHIAAGLPPLLPRSDAGARLTQ